jgi:hypothetical protein
MKMFQKTIIGTLEYEKINRVIFYFIFKFTSLSNIIPFVQEHAQKMMR